MIENIDQYIKKGKIKLALESILQFAESTGNNELKDRAIENIGRLQFIDAKLLNGTISLHEAEPIINRIRLATINLANTYEMIAESYPPKEFEDQPFPNYSLVGKWVSEFFSPYKEQNVKLYWSVYANNYYTAEFYSLDGLLLKRGEGHWALDNGNVYRDRDHLGNEGIGKIEWFNPDRIIYTIETSTCRRITNFKRDYKRLLSNQ